MSGGQQSNGVGVARDRAQLAKLLEARRIRIEPLSYGQAALWHLNQLAPESSAYNTAFTARAPGLLDLVALQRAATKLVARHATLRTTYRFAKDRPVQVVHHELPVDWAEVDASHDTAAERRARVVADFHRPFDLEQGPILRIRAYRYGGGRDGGGRHLLLIAVHHVAIDFASLRTLVSDLGALYRAERSGAPPDLAPLRAEYSEFARAQLARLASPDGELMLEFWRRELDGAPPRLDLSTRPRGAGSAVQSFAGATHSLVLESDLVRAVAARSASENVTLYHTLCATLAVLLSRHSGERDIVFGITTTSRDRLELENLVGYFINTPPLRIDLRDNHTFRDLLTYVRQKVIAVLEHADYPLLLMSQKLAVQRDPSYTPIFQVSFNMLHEHAGGEMSAWWGDIDSGASIDFGGQRLEPFPVPLQDGILDLSVWACEVGGRIYLEFKYNTGLFDRDAIVRMAQHYRALLAAISADPVRSVDALPMLDHSEQHQILDQWNATAAEYDRDARLDHLFEAQAQRTPDATAVAVAVASWTYRQLANHSDRLAGHLQSLGAGPGTLVAVCMDRRLEMISTVLAVVKAGAAYVPIDPSLPAARIQSLLSRHGIRIAITDEPASLALREMSIAQLAHVISVDTGVDTGRAATGEQPTWREWAAETWASAAAPRRTGTADDIAYVIFTSGSTGAPKGVVVRHRPVINLIEWVNRTFHVGPADRMLCVSSLSFDLSVYDIFGVLAAGGTVRLATTPELREPERLLDIVVDEHITFWNSAPAMLQQLVPLFPALGHHSTELRLAFFSGDWIPLTLPDDLRKVFPGVQVISLGGATEAVVWSNCFPVGALDPSWVSIPYGRPIQNARYYVLNEARQPCPVGVSGDLYIGGECLASGYLDDPELTASKFVPDPFVAGPHATMYRTGDRARFFPDGNIEFLGRLDDQVKIRGFRIELGEIEAALREHPAIQDCALVAIGERDLKQIAAYVVTRVRFEDMAGAAPTAAPAAASAAFAIVTVGEETRRTLWLSEVTRAGATVVDPPGGWTVGTRVRIMPRSAASDLARELPAVVIAHRDGSAVLQLDQPLAEGEELASWGWQPPVASGGVDRAKHAGDGREVLRAYLRERLPEYMIPAYFVACDRLPVTANGKLDRRALPVPEVGSNDAGHGYVAPRNSVEDKLAAVWADVLRVERVSVQASFFDLGGHSLLATQLLARIRAEFGVALPLRTLFAAPTVAALAAEVAGVGAGADADAGDGLPQVRPEPTRRFEPFPLTDVQQAYWIGRRNDFEIGNVSTQLYQEFELSGIDIPRLATALRALIARHDGLRTIVRADGMQQVLAEVPPYELETLDLSSVPASEVHDRLVALREARCYRARDPGQWPLFDVLAVRLSAQAVRLTISIDVLIADARSLGILGLEWLRLYEHPDRQLPPLEINFRDYVIAETGLRGLPVYQRSLAYWRSRIATLPGGPELPIAKSPHAITQPRFVRRTTRVDRDTWDRIKQCISRAGVTVASALAAAFAETLSAWSRTTHFTLNLTLMHRIPLHPQAEALVGDFTSLTLLEIDATQAVPFEQRARACHDQLWSDLDHRYVSGVQVMRERAQARPGAGLSYMPVVFTCVLDVVPDDAKQLEFFERHAKVGFGLAQTPQVWLDYQSIETSRGLVINWDGLEELFPPGMIDDMFAAHLGLLLGLADAPSWERTIGSLVPAEQQARHDRVNATAMALDGGLLHTAFYDRARERPEAPAVISSKQTLSYGELSRRATAVGRWLRLHGARPGDRVAVVMTKGWEEVVAALGCHAAGAAYVPVDASVPEARIHRLLALSGAALVLTQTAVDAHLTWPDGVACLAVDHVVPGTDDEVPLEPVQQPGDLAYVIFTSGSTGEPKGVMMQHAATANTIADINQRYRVGANDRVLAVSALSFDLSVWDIFGVLAAGGAMVLPDAEGRRDPWHWVDLVRQHGVTVWNSVPALMELVVEYLHDAPRESLPSLRLVMMSGDWIPVTLPDRIRTCSPHAATISLGGATEAAIWSVAYPIGDVDPAWRSIPYGTPLANQQLLVLDSALRPRPDWVTGDLYIGGVGLALGYWDDPAKTARSFITDPRTGARLYRTGDLARRLPAGELEFLGRIDHQVKIHGHRVELGEIESALIEHPAVQAAAVIVRSASSSAQQLEAYVVLRDGTEETEDDLRDALRRRLPSYMVPTVFARLDALPLSGNGKVDRAALRPPAIRAAAERASIGLRTTYEVLVAEVWSQVLDVTATSAEDDFFVSGGDSIRAIQVAQKLRRRLPGCQLTVGDLYAAPTLGELAAQLQHASAGAAGQASESGSSGDAAPRFDEIERLPAAVLARLTEDYEDVYPANSVQQLIVRESAKAPLGGGVYHLQQMLEIRIPEPEIATFRQALAAVVGRVRSLRSVFLTGVCEHPLVAVRRRTEVVIPQDDLRALSPEAQGARLDAMFAEDRNHPFDVGSAGTALVRFRLLRRSDTDFTLFFSAHHALWDGWSNAEFYSQLHAEHGRIRAGLADPGPARVDTSREFVAWERRKLATDGAAAQDYWAAHLAGAPARPSRERPGTHPAWHPPVMSTLDPHEFAALEQVARDLRITVKALLMRAFLDVFAPAPEAGVPGDRIVGMVANRRSDELTDPWSAMGLFWNIVPFRFTLTANPRSDALAIHSRLLEAEAHVWYPPRDPSGEPRRSEPYQVLFNFINLHNLRTNDGSLLEFRSLRAYDRYHLPLNSLFAVTPGTRGLSLRLEFDPRWYDAAEVVALGERLVNELRNLAGHAAAGRSPRSASDPSQIALRAERVNGAPSRERAEVIEK